MRVRKKGNRKYARHGSSNSKSALIDTEQILYSQRPLKALFQLSQKNPSMQKTSDILEQKVERLTKKAFCDERAEKKLFFTLSKNAQPLYWRIAYFIVDKKKESLSPQQTKLKAKLAKGWVFASAAQKKDIRDGWFSLAVSSAVRNFEHLPDGEQPETKERLLNMLKEKEGLFLWNAALSAAYKDEAFQSRVAFEYIGSFVPLSKTQVDLDMIRVASVRYLKALDPNDGKDWEKLGVFSNALLAPGNEDVLLSIIRKQKEERIPVPNSWMEACKEYLLRPLQI